MPPKDADGIANSENSDQTAPLGADGSSLIKVYTVFPDCLSENLRSLR